MNMKRSENVLIGIGAIGVFAFLTIFLFLALRPKSIVITDLDNKPLVSKKKDANNNNKKKKKKQQLSNGKKVHSDYTDAGEELIEQEENQVAQTEIVKKKPNKKLRKSIELELVPTMLDEDEVQIHHEPLQDFKPTKPILKNRLSTDSVDVLQQGVTYEHHKKPKDEIEIAHCRKNSMQSVVNSLTPWTREFREVPDDEENFSNGKKRSKVNGMVEVSSSSSVATIAPQKIESVVVAPPALPPVVDNQLIELRSKFNKTQKDLKQAQQELQTGKEKLFSVEKELKLLKNKEDEARRTVQVVQAEFAEVIRKNKSLERDRENTFIRLNTVEAEFKRVETSLNQTQHSKNLALQENQKLLQQVASLNSKVNISAQNSDLISRDNMMLKNRLEQMENDLQRQQVDLQSRMQACEKVWAEKEKELITEVNKSRSLIDKMERDLLGNKDSLETEKTRKEELSQELGKCRNEAAQQKDLLSSMQYQFSVLSADKELLAKKTKEISGQFEATITELQARIHGLESQLAGGETARHSLEQQLDQLRRSPTVVENDEAGELARCKAALLNTEEILCRLEETVVKEEAGWSASLKQKEVDCHSLQRQVDSLKSELRDTQNQVKRLNFELKSAKVSYGSPLSPVIPVKNGIYNGHSNETLEEGEVHDNSNMTDE